MATEYYLVHCCQLNSILYLVYLLFLRSLFAVFKFLIFNISSLIGAGILHIGFVYNIFFNKAGVLDFYVSICPHLHPVIRFCLTTYHSEHFDCMQVNSAILVLSLALTCSFSFIAMQHNCRFNRSWSDARSGRIHWNTRTSHRFLYSSRDKEYDSA